MERYAPDQAQNSFQTRQRTQTESALFKELTGRMYRPEDYYGQTMPDTAWVNRKDRRGLCIPPYLFSRSAPPAARRRRNTD